MNRRRICGLFLLPLFSTTLLWCQLSGTKTIGGASPDYATFGEAITALNTQGVSGPVVFQVRPGTYLEQLIIDRIPGGSAANSVTFEGASAALCTLRTAATTPEANYVVLLDTASYVTLRNLTIHAAGTNYARAILLKTFTHNIVLDGNTFIGKPDANGSYEHHALVYAHNQGVDSITACRNTFHYGGYGFYLGDPSDPTVQDSVYDNTFFMNKYVAIGFNSVVRPYIANNTVDSTTGYGISIYGSNGGGTILRNRISSANEGIQLSSLNGYSSGRVLIANNMISAGQYGINASSCTFVDFFYNSVCVTGWDSVASAAMLLQNSTYFRVFNNTLTAHDHGMAFRMFPGTSIIECDYNNLYTPDVILAEWGNRWYDLQEFQDSTGTNLHSLSAYPFFVSWKDLTPISAWLNGKANPIAEVTTDITGAPRDASQPDLGAVEFLPSGSALPPLAGTYTVGTGGDFPDFPSAAGALMLKGISGAVTLNILPGSHACNLIMLAVPGATSARTVTIQSASADTTDTRLTHSAVADADNYILRLKGADHLRFRNLTFQALGSLYAHTIEITGGTDDLIFENNLFRGLYWTDAQYRAALFVANAWRGRRFDILNNTFRVGGQGLFLDNALGTTSSLTLRENRFDAIGYRAGWVRGVDIVEITDNTVNGYPVVGLEIYGSRTRTVLKNNILCASYTGLILSQVAAPASTPGLMTNNFISVSRGAGNDSRGVSMNQVTNLCCYHNSVCVSGFSQRVPALSITNGSSGIELINNCFAHLGYGMAFDIPYSFGSDPVTVSHHNNWYTGWNYLGYYQTSYLCNLEEFQSATGHESGSLSVYPHFVSPSDLHTVAPWLDGKGIRLDSVLTDIDGEPRLGPATADIGADEFSSDPALTPWSGVMTVGSGGDIPDLATAARDLYLLPGSIGRITGNPRITVGKPGISDGHVRGHRRQ
jgi:parallel beta-helix repeat protein